MSETKTRAFEAEVAQVLHLVTHSLYSNKEIFLRELVSNASDACDKLRFAAISAPELLDADPELRIEIECDVEQRTIRITDNGIGMSMAEAIDNLGTIARSGTRRFLDALAVDARAGSHLIGQFGVGFYSSFVVADRVEVESRGAGLDPSEGVRWTSDGISDYQVERITRAARGTAVTLHLKASEDEFLATHTLKGLIARYSDHIAFPVRMPDAAGEGWTTVNQASALWTRPKSEISDDEYRDFYRALSHDLSAPLAWTHNRVEGKQSYTSVLFLPEHAPWDALLGARDERSGLKLYVRRVFIMDAAQELVPGWLRFVRGVVDSDDLPLNISREILQDNHLVSQIRAGIVKRVLDLLDKLASDEPAQYLKFWNSFGNVFKEGFSEEFANRERMAKLLRFASTHTADAAQNVALDDYVARMQPGQSELYYITADSHAAAVGSPQLEALRARNVEVLLLSDRIDEWMTGSLHSYDGKPLRNVAKGELRLDGLPAPEQPQPPAANAEAASALIARLKQILGERVAEVRIGQRLIDSPACLVLGEQEMALHLRKLLAQAGHELPQSKPVLEVQPGHPLLQRLAATDDADEAQALGLWLYEQAVLAEGGQLDDPAAFVRRLNGLLLGPQQASSSPRGSAAVA